MARAKRSRNQVEAEAAAAAESELSPSEEQEEEEEEEVEVVEVVEEVEEVEEEEVDLSEEGGAPLSAKDRDAVEFRHVSAVLRRDKSLASLRGNTSRYREVLVSSRHQEGKDTLVTVAIDRAAALAHGRGHVSDVHVQRAQHTSDVAGIGVDQAASLVDGSLTAIKKALPQLFKRARTSRRDVWAMLGRSGAAYMRSAPLQPFLDAHLRAPQLSEVKAAAAKKAAGKGGVVSEDSDGEDAEVKNIEEQKLSDTEKEERIKHHQRKKKLLGRLKQALLEADKDSVPLLPFAMAGIDFAKAAEAMFDLSFLIKEGKVSVAHDALIGNRDLKLQLSLAEDKSAGSRKGGTHSSRRTSNYEEEEEEEEEADHGEANHHLRSIVARLDYKMWNRLQRFAKAREV